MSDHERSPEQMRAKRKRGVNWKRVTPYEHVPEGALASLPVGTVVRVSLSGGLCISIRKDEDLTWSVFCRTGVDVSAFAGMRVAKCIPRGTTPVL